MRWMQALVIVVIMLLLFFAAGSQLFAVRDEKEGAKGMFPEPLITEGGKRWLERRS